MTKEPPLQKLIDSTLILADKEKLIKEKEKMDNIVTQIKALFSPKTRRGRAIRTTLQGAIAVATFFAGLLAIPGLEQSLYDAGAIAQLGVFSVWIGIISYIQNALEALIKYLWNE